MSRGDRKAGRDTRSPKRRIHTGDLRAAGPTCGACPFWARSSEALGAGITVSSYSEPDRECIGERFRESFRER